MLDIVRNASLVRRVTKEVYCNSKFARLRTQIEEEDLVQIVFLKLIDRDNYKLYKEGTSLYRFLYMVANGCAIQFSKKRSNMYESAVLDFPKDTGDDKKSIPNIVSTYDLKSSLDTKYLIKYLKSKLDKIDNTNHSHIVIRSNTCDIPFSLGSFFEYFLQTKFNKQELRKHIINNLTNIPVSYVAFDKWWNTMESEVTKELLK